LRRLASCSVAVLVLVTTAAAAHVAAAPATGVRGAVRRGPIHPVCAAEQPCTAPAKKVVLHFVGTYSSGWTRTDATGHYALALVPGVYTVKIPSAKFGYRPRAVTVRANRMSVLDITIDTGIR
jgi:hypothetical protein